MVPPQIVASGDTSHAGAVLHVDYRQADTGGCAAEPTLDPGTNPHASLPGYGAYLLCAWLLNGWTTTDNPPTVAGPIPASVTAVRPETFRGPTSQRLPIEITLAPVEGQVVDISYRDRLHCGGTATFTNGSRWKGLWSNNFGTRVFGKLQVGRSSACPFAEAGVVVRDERIALACLDPTSSRRGRESRRTFRRRSAPSPSGR